LWRENSEFGILLEAQEPKMFAEEMKDLKNTYQAPPK
jgi:hypothetical protein